MILEGLFIAVEPMCLLLTVLGTVVGIVFGCIPGLSAVIAITMFLPLTYGMEPARGIALLIGLYTGAISGGLISAILLKIPGTSASIATLLDGHPMARNGEAGKALGAAILSSFVGGMLGIMCLIFISPWLAEFSLKFWPAEYFAICLFSMTVIASLAGKSLIKGLCSGILGLALSLIGMGPIDGTMRFTFGQRPLYSGLNMVAVFIGLYAGTEILIKGFNRRNIKDNVVQNKINNGFGLFGLNRVEMLRNIPNMLRSSIIGTLIGILPGIGGDVGGMVAYDVARRSSKEKEKFGTGYVDGVVASEAANNAVIGGALIPLLTLGIPGNTVSALLLGALTIHNITPGPFIFKSYGSIMFSLFFSLIIANTAMLIFERGMLKSFVKVLALPKNFLMPLIMILCFVGCYSGNFRTFDIKVAIVFAVIGLVLHWMEIPLMPMSIGYILGPTFEYNLRKALIQSGGSWICFFQRPISCTFMVIAALSIIFILWSRRKEQKQSKTT